MKTLLLIPGLFFIALAGNAQPTYFNWAKNMAGNATCEGKSITTDINGNVLTAGILRGTADFDPGPGVYNLTSAGEADIFISKLDANGNFLWAKQIGTSTTDQGESIATDAGGNVYVTGWFTGGGPCDFDPGPGVFNLAAGGTNETYILKLAANGDFIWAKSIEGLTHSEYGTSLALDAAGNLFVTGAFYNLVNFDPGFSDFSLTSAGTTDIFITKFDVAGNFLWAKQLGSASAEYPYKMAIDATGNLLITGYFADSGDFDPGAGVFNLVSAGNTDLFVSKLNNNGDFIWAKSMGSAINDFCNGITTDLSGNVFLATSFNGTFDADPGPGVSNVTSAGQFDVFICKLNAAGDFQWAKRWGAAFNDAIYEIKTDAAGNVYTGGSFGGTVDFDPGPAQFLLAATDGSDLFYSKFDGDGNFVWAVSLFGGGGTMYGVHINAANEIFSTGYFSQTIDFDPGAGVFNLTATVTDIFVHKLGQVALGPGLPLTLLDFSGTATAAGNALRWETAQEINTKDFEIEWGIDGIHFEKIATQMAAGNSASSHYNYLHTTGEEGENYYRLKMRDIDGQSTRSPVIKISTKKIAATIKTFPNPVPDMLRVTLQSSKNETVLLHLFSADGRLTATESFKVIKGSNQLTWDVKSIAAGNYFIVAAGNQFKPIVFIKK
jgi:hypothetical protein